MNAHFEVIDAEMIDLNKMFGDNPKLDVLLSKAKKRVIAWKPSRLPWLALIRSSDCPSDMKILASYDDWVVVALKDLDVDLS